MARGLKRCFGLDTAVVTASSTTRWAAWSQDLIYQGGVDQSHRPLGARTTASAAPSRNGLNFTERGFGVRAAPRLLRPRPHRRRRSSSPATSTGTASSARRARAGSTPAASSRRSPRRRRSWPRRPWRPPSGTAPSSPTTSTTAPRSGSRSAGKKRAQEVNRELAPLRGRDARQRGGLHRRPRLRGRGPRREPLRARPRELPPDDRAGGRRSSRTSRSWRTTLRNAKTATINDWGAVCCVRRRALRGADAARTSRSSTAWAAATRSPPASIYGFLAGKGPQWAVDCGAAHGALAMTTPGDTTMATLPRSSG